MYVCIELYPGQRIARICGIVAYGIYTVYSFVSFYPIKMV